MKRALTEHYLHTTPILTHSTVPHHLQLCRAPARSRTRNCPAWRRRSFCELSATTSPTRPGSVPEACKTGVRRSTSETTLLCQYIRDDIAVSISETTLLCQYAWWWWDGEGRMHETRLDLSLRIEIPEIRHERAHGSICGWRRLHLQATK